MRSSIIGGMWQIKLYCRRSKALVYSGCDSLKAVMISCIIVTNLKIDEMELDSKPGKKVETVIKLYEINADAK